MAHDGVTGAQRMYLAMERLSGETLAERLARAELTLAASFSLGARIASALGIVHREGIVHRDLKPSNTSPAGVVVEGVTLIDSRTARVSGVDQRLTATGAMLVQAAIATCGFRTRSRRRLTRPRAGSGSSPPRPLPPGAPACVADDLSEVARSAVDSSGLLYGLQHQSCSIVNEASLFCPAPPSSVVANI